MALATAARMWASDPWGATDGGRGSEGSNREEMDHVAWDLHADKRNVHTRSIRFGKALLPTGVAACC